MASRQGWHLFEEVDERAGGDSDLPLLSVSIHHGVVPQEAVTDRLPRAEEFAHYKICAAGDLVINRMCAFQGAVGMSGFRGLVSPDYSVLRVRPPNNARFLQHLFRSNWFIGEMTARLRGIGTSEQGNVRTPRINVEDLRDIPIPVLRPEVQQRLAAFLDGETARIGALIEKKQRMGDLLEQALEGRIAALIESVIQGHPVLPQRRLTVIGFSNVDKKSEEGQEVVKLCNYTDVYYQEEIRGELDFVVATASAGQIRRFTLQAGDVLATKDSESADDIGVPAWVPRSLPGVVCGYHLALIRPDRSRLRGDYLYWVLRSSFGRQQLSAVANGVTRFGLRVEAIRSIQVPVPDLTAQAKIASDLKRASAATRKAAEALRQQVALFREHRQALITAAVTGQIDLSASAA